MRNKNYLNSLVAGRFGVDNENLNKQIFNFSNVTEIEQMVHSCELDFCIPPSKIRKEQIFSEFELMYSQLNQHIPFSAAKISVIEARLLE